MGKLKPFSFSWILMTYPYALEMSVGPPSCHRRHPMSPDVVQLNASSSSALDLFPLYVAFWCYEGSLGAPRWPTGACNNYCKVRGDLLLLFVLNFGFLFSFCLHRRYLAMAWSTDLNLTPVKCFKEIGSNHLRGERYDCLWIITFRHRPLYNLFPNRSSRFGKCRTLDSSIGWVVHLPT